MVTVRVGRTRPATQVSDAEQAARSLYASIRPEGGLEFAALSPAQQDRYRGLIRMAQRCGENAAVNAANEAVAELLAVHNDESLDCVPREIRKSYRERALALNLMFERVLMNGTPETDAKILARVRHDISIGQRLAQVKKS